MNITALALVPGVLVGAGLALLLLVFSPRSLRAGDALARLGQAPVVADAGATGVSGWERVGGWLALRSPQIRYFMAPTSELDLLDITVTRFYATKAKWALIGFAIPLVCQAFLTLVTHTQFYVPLIASPLVAFIFWISPDAQVKASARIARREFTKFTAVYLQLLSVALLGNTTVDSALIDSASVSDSWVFQRIRREFAAAEITRISKWEALERLGVTVGVPPLVDMARTLRLAEAKVSLRDQLLASYNMLRAQVGAEDKNAAERVTKRMSSPVYATLLPILALVLFPAVMQIFTI